jgi:type VI secretion system FHA domain protein
VDLILEVISPQPSALGGAARQSFGPSGGTIGRESDNSWVLPHPKISGRHAVITYAHGVFYIEDTSRNGVFLNSSRNRLTRGEPHPLAAGDRVLIDPYEIRVSIATDDALSRGRVSHLPDVDPFDLLGDPAANDPFAPQPMRQPGLDVSALDAPDAASREELDPLALLNLQEDRPAARKAPSARDLDRGLPLDAHFRPPAAVPDARPVRKPADPIAIPHDYDPLAPDEPVVPPAPPPLRRPAPEPPPHPVERVPQPADPDPRPLRPRFGKPPSVDAVPPQPELAPPPAAPASTARGADLATVLEGAGLSPADVTPELARAFGEILRVVVNGVMDVLQSRRQIKDEFRMRMTQFRPTENNPLKFSANVEDALHNLLVKRNAAYLGPVEAFEDAFAELRNHQLAMLAGMRVAFESMLAEFDPDRLQEDFDRQPNKGLVPAKLRYWDLFREKRRQMVKDPEATFRQLFGEEFARAYEEQLKQLKSQDARVASAPSKPNQPEDS